MVQPAASMLSQRAIRQDCLHLAQQPNWLSLSISSFFQQLQLERRRRCRRCQRVQYCACLLRHTCLVVLPTLNSGLAQYMSNASLHAIHAGWHVRVRLVTYRLCHRSKMQLCLCAYGAVLCVMQSPQQVGAPIVLPQVTDCLLSALIVLTC